MPKPCRFRGAARHAAADFTLNADGKSPAVAGSQLYVFYQPIAVCGFKASPSGVNAGADHKESVSIAEAVSEFIPDLVGGLLRVDDPGAVELKGSTPTLRDAL